MVVFAFSPNAPTGYFVSFESSMTWSSLPQDLVRRLEKTHAEGEIVEGLTLGRNDWFLNTDKSIWCADISLVDKFLESPDAKEEKLTLGQIEVFVFMPDPSAYFVKANGLIFWGGLPPEMEEDIRTHTDKSGIRCVAAGFGGQWIVVHKDGSMAYDKLGADLVNELRNRGSKDVKFITLSLDMDDYFFIEYDDGSCAYCFRTAWQKEVCKYISTSQSETLARRDMEDALDAQRKFNDMRSTQRTIELLNMSTRMADAQIRENALSIDRANGYDVIEVERTWY